MFVNRLLKTLSEDVAHLAGHNSKMPLSKFLFPMNNMNDPYVELDGRKLAAVQLFYYFLTDEVMSRLPSLKLGECQFFDFGWIDNEHVKEESITVAEGYEAGLIDLPSSVCWMEHSWVEDDGLPIMSGYLYVHRPNGQIAGAEIRRIKHNDLQKLPPFAKYSQIAKRDEYFVWDGVMCTLPKNATALDGYKSDILINSANIDVEPNNVFDSLMSMLGRLNADGIDREYNVAPAKLNKQRVSKGEPGLVSYTNVKIRPYRAALGHSGPRDGATTSKRYHFRRGHVRHFQNGQKTWVRPCFVGDPSDGVVKHTYIVED